ncbi:MAG: HU family DNA-binding protein, partial [Candidatus Pacebacteria bacterium]|nr:HU family DNA-binding protein [Candidatus Paceibacterota bacterium]
MTKDELIEAVAAKTDMSKKDAERAVSAVLETVTSTLVEGGKV